MDSIVEFAFIRVVRQQPGTPSEYTDSIGGSEGRAGYGLEGLQALNIVPSVDALRSPQVNPSPFRGMP